MKKNLVRLLLCVLVGGILAGCNSKEEVIDSTLIFGLWQEQEGGKMDGDHLRFLTAEQEAQEGDCYFGKGWDEDDDVYEKDLVYKGNGWFKWKIDGNTLSKYKRMDYGWATVPETYTIKSLSASQMVLQESGEKETETWIKQ